jgi:tetratricopeptide (TPR) repeat protein
MEYVDKIDKDKDPIRASKCKGFVLIGRGVESDRADYYEKAIEAFEEEAKEKKGLLNAYADTFAGKGIANIGLKKNYEEAIKHFEEALNIKGSLRYVQINKAIVSYSLGLYEEAIKCFDRILESKEDDDIYFFRGQSKCGVGDYIRALEDFNEVKSGDFAAAEKDASIGECYYGLGFYEDAEDEYRKAIRSDPKLVRAYYNLAVLYASENKYDMAKKRLDTCLKIDRDFSDAREAIKKLEQSTQSDWYRWWFGGDEKKDKRVKGNSEKSWEKRIDGKRIIGATVMASIAVLTILIVILAFKYPSTLAPSVVAMLTIPLAILVGILLLPSLRRFKAAGIELEPVLFATAETAKLSESLYNVTIKNLRM